MTTESQKSSRQTVSLFILRLIKTMVSLTTLILSARYFGVSSERDAWILSFNCMVIIDLAIWGPLNETFRAKFIFMREQEGEHTTIRKVSSLFIFTGLITSLLFILIMLFPSAATRIISPGSSEENIAFLNFMIRMLAPTILFNQATLLLSSILNAYNIFYIPEIAGFASAVINLILIIVLAPKIGIYSLMISYYIGLLILIVLLLFQVKKNKIALFSSPVKFRFSDVKPYLLFALPFFFPYFFGQLNGIAEKSIASLLGTGTVSIIDYSRRFIDIPLSVLSGILSTILVPLLSQNFVKNNIEGFKTEFKNIFQLGIFILGTLLAYLILASEDLINVLYNSGKIGQADLNLMGHITIVYGLSAVAMYYYIIIGLSLLSAEKAKIYAACGVAAQIIMLLFNWLCYQKIGIYIFPVSLIVSHAIAAAVMIFNLKIIQITLLKISVKYISIVITFSLISYFSNVHLFSLLPFTHITLLCLKSLYLFVMMMTAIFTFNLDEKFLIIKGFETIKTKIAG